MKKFLLVFISAIVFSLFLTYCSENNANKKTEVKEVPELTDLESGKTLYSSYCQICHGEEGDGPMSDLLKIKPPNLTTIAQRNGGVFDEKAIYDITSGENALKNGHGDRVMPIWGEALAASEEIDQQIVPEKINQLVIYLKSIQK